MPLQRSKNAEALPNWPRRDPASFALLMLVAIQGGYFLAASAPPLPRRVVGVALTGIFFAEWWRPWLTTRSPRWGVVVLATVCLVNVLAAVVAMGVAVDARFLLMAIVAGLVVFGMAAALAAAGLANPGRSSVLSMTILVLVVYADAWLAQHREWLTTGIGAVVEGRINRDRTGVPKLAPGSMARTRFPSDPRLYFEDPQALRSTWRLQINDVVSAAELSYPDTMANTVRVRIDRTSMQTPWDVEVAAVPVPIRSGEHYSISFRARSTAPATVIANVGLDRPPWDNLGFTEAVSVDSQWSAHRFDFVPRDTTRVAKLYFDVGMQRTTIDLADVRLQQSDGAPVVPVLASPEVRYRINHDGCRGADAPREHPDGIQRILVLGGASAFGIGVHEEDTFASRLTDALGAPRVQVLNCGYVGGTPQAASAFAHGVVSTYSPDVVVVALGRHEATRVRSATFEESRSAVEAVSRLSLVWQLCEATGIRRRAKRWETWTSDDLAALAGSLNGTRVVLVVLRTGDDTEWRSLVEASKAVGGRIGASVIDAGPAIRARYPTADLAVYGAQDRRPNELVHRAAAETTAVALMAGLRGHR